MQSFSFKSTQQLGYKASIGLIVMSSDEVLEYELSRWLSANGVALYVSRIPMALHNTPETLIDMGSHLAEAAALLPPRVDYDVIAYGCTSASSVIGHAQVDRLLASGRRARHYTNPLKSLEAFCVNHGWKTLDVLAPYSHDSLSEVLSALKHSGFAVNRVGSFNEPDDTHVARIAESSIRAAAQALSPPGCNESDGLFLSCTNLRTQSLINDLNFACGKPVVSSNYAMAWHIATLAGLPALACC
jgi:maleate isomerase